MKVAFLVTGLLVIASTAVAQNASHYGRGDGYWNGPVACKGWGRHKPGDMTTAHKTLPCGTKVKLTNPRNGKSVVVTVNNRGPFVRGREWDVNSTVADQLGFSGVATLNSEIVK